MVEEATRNSLSRKAHGFLVNVTAVLALLAKRTSTLRRRLKAALPEPPATARENWRSSKKLLRDLTLKLAKKKKGEGWGVGGVWQKAIMMGDKCEPLDFSGVIYYDSHGKQVNELPHKSPRAGHVSGY